MDSKRLAIPFAIGTKVRPKYGSDRHHEWIVFDHHGVTWAEGEDMNEVVIARWVPAPGEWGKQGMDDQILLRTTWGRIEAI